VSRTFRTVKAAERFERDQLGNRDRGEWIDPAAGRVTLTAWAEEWQRPAEGRFFSLTRRAGIYRRGPVLVAIALDQHRVRVLASSARESSELWK
jgi:hypothetical protein